MLNKLKNRKEGFTIIEVLIVLAIAGLILLIVFLAVPALQRNSRNTQRKNDVAALLGALSEYGSNNAGKFTMTASNLTNNAKLSQFDVANVSVQCRQNLTVSVADAACAGAAVTDPTNLQVKIVYAAKCDFSVSPVGVTATGASLRNTAVLYQFETSASFTTTCVES